MQNFLDLVVCDLEKNKKIILKRDTHKIKKFIPFLHSYFDFIYQSFLSLVGAPASVGDGQTSLFIKISPPILTLETVQDAFTKITSIRIYTLNKNGWKRLNFVKTNNVILS